MINKQRSLKITFTIIILALAASVLAIRWVHSHYWEVSDSAQTTPPPSPEVSPPNPPEGTPPPATIPETKLLAVPFTPQAPTANWDELHNEACEEASSIMAAAFFSGMKEDKLDPSFVEDELAKITQWEKETFGYYLDINSTETAKLLNEFYGLNARVETSFTENSIKQEIAKGNLVLFPAAGRLLGNPNFRAPGPPYHMIVIKGYTKTNFISNDPGTRKGQNYPYTYDVLRTANGEWDHNAHAVDTNNKSIIIVSAK